MTARTAELSALLRQIEDLVRFPPVIGHATTVRDLASSIAREAPSPAIALLATQLAEGTPAGPDDVQFNKLVWKLRQALQNSAD